MSGGIVMTVPRWARTSSYARARWFVSSQWIAGGFGYERLADALRAADEIADTLRLRVEVTDTHGELVYTGQVRR